MMTDEEVTLEVAREFFAILWRMMRAETQVAVAWEDLTPLEQASWAQAILTHVIPALSNAMWQIALSHEM